MGISQGQTLIPIAIAQAKRGDISGAQRTADLIQPDSVNEKSGVQAEIVAAQANGGDIAGAQKTVDLIKVASYRSGAQSAIAEALAKSGDIAGAQKNLASALKTADLIQDAGTKTFARYMIADAQAEAGNIVGAKKTADLIQDVYWKIQTQLAIVEVQAKSGDITGGQKTFREMQKIADLSQEAGTKSWAPEVIARAKAAVTTNAPISIHQSKSNWLEKLDDDDKGNDCPLNTAPFLDLAGYLKSLPPSSDPQKVFAGLHKTAENLVKAQNVIAGMLKQQAGK